MSYAIRGIRDDGYSEGFTDREKIGLDDEQKDKVIKIAQYTWSAALAQGAQRKNFLL